MDTRVEGEERSWAEDEVITKPVIGMDAMLKLVSFTLS